MERVPRPPSLHSPSAPRPRGWNTAAGQQGPLPGPEGLACLPRRGCPPSPHLTSRGPVETEVGRGWGKEGKKKEKGEVAWWRQQRWSQGATSPNSGTQEERKRPPPPPRPAQGGLSYPASHPPQVHIATTTRRASRMHAPTPPHPHRVCHSPTSHRRARCLFIPGTRPSPVPGAQPLKPERGAQAHALAHAHRHTPHPDPPTTGHTRKYQ